MQVGIDWVSAAIFLVAFIIAQIRAIPVRVRYVCLAGSCAAIGFYRLRLGAVGPNLIFVVLAFGLAVYYLTRAMRMPR